MRQECVPMEALRDTSEKKTVQPCESGQNVQQNYENFGITIHTTLKLVDETRKTASARMTVKL